jgi:hypothetical protein
VSGCALRPIILHSAPYSLPPHAPFRHILASAPGSLPPHTPFRPSLPSAPYPRSPPAIASAPYSLPPHWQARFAPCSLPPVGVCGCLSAEVECDGAALASCSVSMCECAALKRGGSQAHPLPSCAPVVAGNTRFLTFAFPTFNFVRFLTFGSFSTLLVFELSHFKLSTLLDS